MFLINIGVILMQFVGGGFGIVNPLVIQYPISSKIVINFEYLWVKYIFFQ